MEKERKFPVAVASTFEEIKRVGYEKNARDERRGKLIDQTGLLVTKAKDITAEYGNTENKFINCGGGRGRNVIGGIHDVYTSYGITPDVKGKVDGEDFLVRIREDVVEAAMFPNRRGFIIEYREDNTDDTEDIKYKPLYLLPYNDIAKDWKMEDVSEGKLVEIDCLIDFMEQSLKEDSKGKLTRSKIKKLFDAGEVSRKSFRNQHEPGRATDGNDMAKIYGK